MADDPHNDSHGGPPSSSPDDSTTPMGAGLGQRQAHREAAALPVGGLLENRYKVLRFIGQGGMGEVYEAEDSELHERVALKTILPEIARQDQSIQRFKREIQLAHKVTHPNVCRIFDLVFHESTIFLTMELLAGETLAQRLRRTGAMQPAEAFPLVAQMAAGLAAAHREGIVHRDFKSSNVMLVPARGQDAGVRAVIMDFGLARRADTGDSSLGLTTMPGAIAGTPAYMAPEQVEGRDITPAADIYALGIVMYEMVTGRCPFDGDTPLSIAIKRLQEPPPSPRSHNPGLDPKWERAILRCLERHPADRFASAEEIVKAIESGAPAVEPREQPRILEAAAPKRAAVGRSMQVLAMIRRVESEGLKPFVDIEETAPLTKEDIRAKPFRLEFPADRKGAPQAAEIALRLDSPDFEPKSQTKKLMVPPERDSEVCTFLLAPKIGGELLLNLEVLKGEVLVASRAIRTVAEITVQPLAAGQNVLVSIPLEVIAYGLRGTAGRFSDLFAKDMPPAVESGMSEMPSALPADVLFTGMQTPSASSGSGPEEFTQMFQGSRPAATADPKALPPPAPRVMSPAPPPPRPVPPPTPMAQPMPPAPAARAVSFPPPAMARPQPQVGAPPVRPQSFASRRQVRAALTVLLVGIAVGGLYNATRHSPPPPDFVPGLPPPSNSVSLPTTSPTTSASAPYVRPDAPTPSVAPRLAPSPEPMPAPSMAPAPAPGVTAVEVNVRGGDEALEQGEFDDAIADYRRALQMDPYNSGVREKLKEATKACNQEKTIRSKALDCGSSEPETPVPDPKKAKAKFIMGDFHLQRGDYAEAVASYRQGLKLDPFNTDIPQKIELAIRECKEENKVMGEHLKCDEPEPPAPPPNPAPSTHQP